ncbi:hypothetical protein JNK13_05740 [bacterium]|nr:hypothetical protein [bacterium]
MAHNDKAEYHRLVRPNEQKNQLEVRKTCPRAYFVLATATVFILLKLSDFFTSELRPAVDLAGHILLVETLAEQLSHGRIFFYEPLQFSGWPVFTFYGLLPYLFTAVIKITLDRFVADSSVFAVYSVAVVGLALLPWSVYFLTQKATRICTPQAQKDSATSSLVNALFAAIFTILFLAYPHALFGLGCRTILQSGFFAQLFAWHILLWLFAYIYNCCTIRSTYVAVPLLTAALILTHTLSTIYFFCLLPLLLIFKIERVTKIFLICLGSLLSMPWILNFIHYKELTSGGSVIDLILTHQYRFVALLILTLMPLLAAQMNKILDLGKQGFRSTLGATFFIVITYGSFNPTFFTDNPPRSVSTTERQVVEYIVKSQPAGLVITEYFHHGESGPFQTPHVIAFLLNRAKIPTWNGVFIQSSLAYRFGVSAIHDLGVEMLSSRLLVPPKSEQLSGAILTQHRIEQLKHLGISTIVSSTVPVAARLAEMNFPQHQIGPYTITTLTNEVEKIRRINAHVVGYLALSSDAPFEFFEELVWNDPELYRQIIPIEINKTDLNYPDQMQILVLAGTKTEELEIRSRIKKDLTILRIPPTRTTISEALSANFNPLLKQLSYLAYLRYIVTESDLRNQLLNLTKIDSSLLSAVNPGNSALNLNFSKENQEFLLSGLEPNGIYLTTYAYAPFLCSNAGNFYRSIGEKILLQSKAESMLLKYRQKCSK